MPKSFSARIFVALIVISGLLVLGDAVLNAKSMPTARFAGVLVGRMCGSKTQNQASGRDRNNVSKFAVHSCGGSADEYG